LTYFKNQRTVRTKAQIGGVVSAIAVDARKENAIRVVCYAEKGTLGKPPQPIFLGNKFT
jgi:hypothetical protein